MHNTKDDEDYNDGNGEGSGSGEKELVEHKLEPKDSIETDQYQETNVDLMEGYVYSNNELHKGIKNILLYLSEVFTYGHNFAYVLKIYCITTLEHLPLQLQGLPQQYQKFKHQLHYQTNCLFRL